MEAFPEKIQCGPVELLWDADADRYWWNPGCGGAGRFELSVEWAAGDNFWWQVFDAITGMPLTQSADDTAWQDPQGAADDMASLVLAFVTDFTDFNVHREARVVDLAALRNELKTQDNLATSDPIFMVQEKNRIWGVDPDYDHTGAMWYSPHLDEPVEDEYRQKLLEEEPDEENWDFREVYYRDQWKNVQPFLTRKAADEFIDAQRHNLKSPRVYVESAHHNREWRFLRELFLNMSIPDAETGETDGEH